MNDGGLVHYYLLCTYVFPSHVLIMLKLLAHRGTTFPAVNFPQNKFLREVNIYFQDFEDLLNRRVNAKKNTVK
jgi:hypothetical protein